MPFYLDNNTVGAELYDCTGKQAFIFSCIYGERTPMPPTTAVGRLYLAWFTDNTQTELICQDGFLVNQWRFSMVQGMIKGPFCSAWTSELSTIGWYTHMQLFGYPLPTQVTDMPSPYGVTWGGQTPNVSHSQTMTAAPT